jgi:cytochrome c oxidase subunit 1
MRSLQPLNVFVSYAAFALAAAQLIFIFNFIWSLFRGRKAEANPWKANTLEWTAPAPIPHGNWNGPLPTVHRWPYDYALAADRDYLPQDAPGSYIGGR